MCKVWTDLLWLAVLFALIVVMGLLLAGGDILLYLAPRMVPMVWLGLGVLVILLIYQLSVVVQRIFEKSHATGGRIAVLLFLAPVLLFFTVTPDQSTPGSLPNQNMQMYGQSAQAEAGEQGNAADGFLPCVLMDETAVFDSSADRFSEHVTKPLKDLVGETITVYGFVYRESSFPDNTIVVSRMMIACCAADSSLVGFYVQLAEDTGLADNEWIRVTGTVRSITLDYYGNELSFPILTDGIIVPCDPPDVDDAYIYP